MADVKPFICCRPRPELAPEAAALPYDVFSRHEASVEIAAHPHSFLRIDKTAALFPSEVDEYDPQVYSRAAELFAADMAAGAYLREEAARYFLYRLQKDGHAQTGIVACAAVDDYETGVLKRHENTRAFKLEDRVRHISALNAQTGPVFVTYRAQEAIDEAVEQVKATAEPLYDFVAPDDVKHTVWRVDDPRLEHSIQTGFNRLDALYIADGHHRAAAAAQIGRERREHGHEGQAGHFLIVAFPSDQLNVLDYNRVVFDTNGLSRDELLARIAERFDVKRAETHPIRPRRRGEFAMWLDGSWYRLTIHDDRHDGDPAANLDVSRLQDHLLAPILGIDDPRSSKRIAYVGGVRGLEELERRAANGGVAFALFPCSLDELFAIADVGSLMPPKSTWFEPKPRSGLFIHELDSEKVYDSNERGGHSG